MSSRPLQHFLSSGPIANLYERQTRCVFTNLGYIQDFLLGGNILVIYLNILTCGGWGASGMPNRIHNLCDIKS